MQLSDLHFEPHEDGYPGHMKAVVPVSDTAFLIVTRGGDSVDDMMQPYALRYVENPSKVGGLVRNLTFDDVAAWIDRLRAGAAG